MVVAWLIKVFLCFSHLYNRRRVRQHSRTCNYFDPNTEQEQNIASSSSSTYHVFVPPLKVCTLGKLRCRIRSSASNNNHSQLKRQPIVCSSNEPQNCAGLSQHARSFTVFRTARCPSLSTIDIDQSVLSQEHMKLKGKKTFSLKDLHGLENRKTINEKIYSSRRSIIQLDADRSSLSLSQRDLCYRRNQARSHFDSSDSSTHSQSNDSDQSNHQHKHDDKFLRNLISKNSSPCEYPSQNVNSATYNSPLLNDESSSTTDSLSPLSKKADKTWRLKIHDQLNKDGSRHFVIHKGNEETLRKRRQQKRAKRSEEKNRKIEEKVQEANQRWQKYSLIDYELVFFISRYYEQLPLCAECRNYFITHRTNVLVDDPRSSHDYAAEAALLASTNKTLSLKSAAKARLIKDYDKQTSIIFNLCDSCLNKCEQIRNQLKQFSYAQKMAKISDQPNTPTVGDEMFRSPSLPGTSPFTSPPISSPSPPSTSPSRDNATNDLNLLYINNVIQHHQIKLQQLYQQSQDILAAQQYQNSYSFSVDPTYLDRDLQSCIRAMQYHCLEILHFQYPDYLFPFPYKPSHESNYLSYRSQSVDNESTESESSSIPEGDIRCGPLCPNESRTIKPHSLDDRLTIETCHGRIEYYNAPLDDFIRGLEVLKCLGTFNQYST